MFFFCGSSNVEMIPNSISLLTMFDFLPVPWRFFQCSDEQR
jgi:hypothetical protein